MALVRPFRAYRFSADATDISELVAPPYDVISPAQREALLARSAHNVVALELPEGPLDPAVPGNRYEAGRETWDAWRESGVLAHDERPAVYVLEQRFEHAGHPVRRRAFIVEVELHPFADGIVLPHERTLPKALGDRFELIKATGANLSQVFGLFDDAQGITDALFAEATSTDPIATATDADGVESLLWRVEDPAFAERVTTVLAEKQIFIADGHHRYTTALAHRDLRREQGAPVGSPADFVMMALVNMEDPELLVLPTHRVADAPGDFDAEEFTVALAELFDVSPAPADFESALADAPRPAFVFRTRDGLPRLAVLREDRDPADVIAVERTDAWKHLDVAVLQELVLSPLLDIHPDRPESLERLGFVKDAREALAAAGVRDVAFVLRATRMDQLRAVALSGETMPQKSTYFFPKLLSGLVLRDAL